MKTWTLLFGLAVIFSGISFLFWQNEWKYNQPTPVPVKYKPVSNGSIIQVSAWVKKEINKPVFFHFFNPDCPCSRFNIAHFKSLVKQYGGQVNFNIVVLAKGNNYTVKEIQDKFDVSLPVFFDSAIASACGVYSTPQAVLIDNNYTLYYRGNYNKGRYCTERNSNYAQMAIESLIQKKKSPLFTLAAVTSYGCSLPVCTK